MNPHAPNLEIPKPNVKLSQECYTPPVLSPFLGGLCLHPNPLACKDGVWTPIVVMGGFASVDSNSLSILCNDYEEARN